jgi:hypothetical protein
MQQDNRPTITIKLKPNLHEFIKRKLDEEDYATKLNIVGTIIRPFLSIRPVGTDPDLTTGPEYITLRLPYFDDLNIRNGTVYMSDENQKHFEKILDAHFKELFYNYVDDKVRYLRKEYTTKGAIKKSILQFCSDYNLSFDTVTYDMLKKSYYRRRKKITKKPPFFSSMLSLNCPLFFLI